LATAIVNNCFTTPPVEESGYRALRQQIAEQLDNPTTLVILDGLDERAGACEALIKQATTGNHKLLMLSRFYGIELESQMADIRVEHVGLSEEQMRDYVKEETVSGLLPVQSGELLSLLDQRHSIAEIAQVPVNLQILCFLWRDQVLQSSVHEAVDQGSLPALYQVVAREVWKRYVARAKALRLPAEVRETMFDTLGKIALEALQKGQLLISQERVDALIEASTLQYPTNMNVQDSGFLLLQWLKGSGLYQFPHLTFQEYFGGRWLAKKFFSSEGEDREEAEDFIRENQYVPRYGRLFSFMAGEAASRPNKKSQRNFDSIVALTHTGSQDLVGVQHLLLQMRLFNEYLCISGLNTKKEESPELEKVDASLKQWLVRGIDESRENAGIYASISLLPLLQTAMQDFRAITRIVAPKCLEVLLKASKEEGHYFIDHIKPVFVKVAQVAPEQCLDTLLEASKDLNRDVRWTTTEALGKVAQAVPQLASKCLDPLLEAIKDKDQIVFSSANGALVKVAKAVPQLASKCLDPLLEVIKDDSRDLRSFTIEAVGEVAQVAPELAFKYLDPILKASKDDREYIRSSAIEALGKIAQVAPELVPKYLDTFLEASKDSNKYVRKAAVVVLGEMAQKNPQLAPRVLDYLLEARKKENQKGVSSYDSQAKKMLLKVVQVAPQQCLGTLLEVGKEEYWRVRGLIKQALGELAQAAPELAPRCLKVLLETSIGLEKNIIWTTAKAFSKAAQAAPQQCLNTLLKASKDEEVREATAIALVAVVQVAPWLAPEVGTKHLEQLLEVSKVQGIDISRATNKVLGEITQEAPQQSLEILLKASKDEDWNVRYAAQKALIKGVQSAPEQCLDTLLEASKDPDPSVRRATIEALGKVAQAAPQLVSKCLAPLLKASEDQDKDVRITTARALAEVVKIVPEVVPKVAPKCLAFFLEASKDTYQGSPTALSNGTHYENVIESATAALTAVLRAAPKLAPKYLETLLRASKDSNEYFRSVTFRSATTRVLEVGSPSSARTSAPMPRTYFRSEQELEEFKCIFP